MLVLGNVLWTEIRKNYIGKQFEFITGFRGSLVTYKCESIPFSEIRTISGAVKRAKSQLKQIEEP